MHNNFSYDDIFLYCNCLVHDNFLIILQSLFEPSKRTKIVLIYTTVTGIIIDSHR